MENTYGYAVPDSNEDTLALLADGDEFVLLRPYTKAESQGVMVRKDRFSLLFFDRTSRRS